MPRPTPAEYPSLGPPLRRSGVAIRPGSHRTLGSLALVLAAAAGWLGPASADVAFTPEFEPGSKWFTEPWSPAARAEMEAYFSDLGQLFVGNGHVVVTVTDDQQSAYVSDHPSWRNYEDTDRAFLRALGYPLAADAQLTLRAPMVGLLLTGPTAEVTCLSSADSHYRLLISRDLQQWRVHPRGMPGTGSPITLTLPLPSEQRGQFFQVVQIPQ